MAKQISKGGIKPGTSASAADARKIAFAEAYIANGRNGTKAAITAGLSPKTAEAQGSRLLKDVRVQALIAERSQKLAIKHELTTDSVIAELSKIVHADPRKLFAADGRMLHPTEWPDEIAGAVASVEVTEVFDSDGDGGKKLIGYTKKLKLWDKNAGIDKAMKHLGLFEADNKQKAGALSELPRDMVKAIVDRLKQLNAEHGTSARLAR